MVIRRTERFNNELKAVFDFIAKDSKNRAIEFIKKMLDNVELLEANPLMGRTITQNKRELIFRGYIIPYMIDDEVIYLLGVYKANEWKS
ncbi:MULTISPECIES: type II toxin-antitoxin system RelE/ParE family toxin [unclassified Campylobacter]|uniref:type II toxin-antitoxin system RelE/ParE family toxin n=1 Tax=unclassified Campylobacter TaxID=2593542 RepID=UPI001474E149|nr:MULTISPECIES: type II toxin-antitoxin system RelE/ParE family toxin [unclassified Campylobacter]